MTKTVLILLIGLSVTLANPAPSTPKIDPFASWRVVGGSVASAGQFPFIISLRTATDSHTCGGSLIRNNWVITAAHCVAGSAALRYTVVAGINQLTATSGVRSNISRVILHPQYNIWTLLYDIALLELETPIQESSLVSLIPLETQDVDSVRNAVLIGWGRTSYPGTIPNDLQFLNSRTVTYNTCKNAWPTQQVEPSQICTYTQHGEGACHGDSGGPLIDTSSGRPVLIGLVSWGAPCAIGTPDVYTRVSSFIDWISVNIN